VPVGRFEHDDPGHRADPNKPNLLKNATKVFELSPHCGTEIQGVQIVSLFVFQTLYISNISN
jgi:sulfonate dioxygenase